MLGGNKAAVAFHGDHRPASVYIDGEAIYEPVESTKEGTMLTFDRTYNDVAEVSVFGESTQDGTPTPDNPVPIVSRASACVETSNADGSKTSTTDITSILNGRELRSLPDGTRDEVQVRADGSVVLVERFGEHKCVDATAVSLFDDGSVSWATALNKSWAIYDSPLMSNRFVLNSSNAYNRMVPSNGSLYMRAKQSVVGNTAKSIRQWLAANETIVLYPLSEPTETILGTIDLPETFYDATHIWEANGADISAIVRVIPCHTSKMLADGVIRWKQS